MIKLIIFDLDGVLVDARELHYNALNKALESIGKKYIIEREEHLSTYDGLSTTKKLNLLSENKKLPKELHDSVWRVKQEKTRQIIDGFSIDSRIQGILRSLKTEGYMIACATNSIRETAKLQLIRKGFFEYIDFMYSNQDVKNPKPNSEIYMRCMIQAGVNPNETLIVEDSHIGRKGAIASGGILCGVKNTTEVTYDKIKKYINDSNNEIKPKWQGGKMNVLIPMAGAGSRFEQMGYTFPKPLIEVNGKPMIQVVVENLNIDAKHIFIVQKSHYEKYNLKYLLNLITNNNCEIVQVDGITEGAACTTLLAKKFIDNDEPMVMANSDQFLEWDSNEFMYSMVADDVDGGIVSFEATHPKWSFAKLGDGGFVSEVAEKKPISNIATVGVYYWRRGSDYVKYAEQMIDKDIRTNNEFYVCPVYNEAIGDDKKVKVFPIDKMWGLGTPEDLDAYLKGKS
ncbi:HAD-IA family hydrolase [Candidatus Woesearchaeota archaeon]|nr:HAD-IA family hydrolase [Candidatus Woesearchaeota archaeon]MBT4732881.1 HAD-IA family hydrolase [Candidatus Woesearchaeota archaeon]MBT7555660.1 HAD-IA family hydrolase [Candidatus Woesearchaeota archaeon]